MVMYRALSTLPSRAMICVMAEKLAMMSQCSVALCHTVASLRVTQASVTSRVTQKMVREANREAEFAEMQEKKEKSKRKWRSSKFKYDYTNPTVAGSRTTKKVNYKKGSPLADVGDVCADDGADLGDGAMKACNHRVSKMKDHIYYNIYPWTTVTELAEHLVRTKIYEDKNYLVLNKPVGVLQDRPMKTSGARCYGRSPPMTYSLLDALPIIKQITGAPVLMLCHAPEKWNSGVTVLAKHPTAMQIAMYDCRSAANEEGVSNKQFWALTRYAPHPAVQARKRIGCMLENFDDVLVPVFVNKASNTSNKRGIVSAFYVDHNTLASSLDTGAALVQIGVTSTKRYALRVWLSHCLAPVLGDHLLGGRVGELIGHPVPVPYSRASSKQNLSYDILQRLDLSPSLQDLLPLFVHLRTVTLSGYHSLVEKVKEERRPKYPNGDPFYGEDLEIEAATELQKEHENDEGLQMQRGKQVLSSDERGRVYKDESREHDRLKLDSKQSHAEASDDLVFTAPLPEHFQWTMERLGVPLKTDDTFGYYA